MLQATALTLVALLLLQAESVMFFTAVPSVIHGYHEYKDTWAAVVGEELSRKREPTNREDQFAVAVTKADSTIVRHVP